MASQFDKPKKNASSLIIHILIVALGLIGGYLYYSQIATQNKEPIILPNITQDDQLGKFKDAKSFDFKIFSNPSFRLLKTLGEVPVQPDTGHKTDLFAPF